MTPRSPLVALLVAVGLLTLASAHAARAQQTPTRRVSVSAAAAQATCGAQAVTAPHTPLDRSLVDTYCVACHNQKLKTAGLTLDTVDFAQPGANADVLEKVLRKVSTGQMPPAGRPRPDRVTAEQFSQALASALDRAASASPNPGRVAVHRLNRLEYVNTVRDLLALEMDPALLPADNGGVGFDNNADILSITPALMNRYMSAATKVSRLAMGDPTIRPATQLYKASDWATQTGRGDEDLPFGARGGFVVRHAFPLDGNYEFKVRLQRNFFGGTIRGIDDEHQVEVRVDGALVQKWQVGGKYKGADPGILIAIPEDQRYEQELHAYHLDADKDFNFTLPVKAGTRVVTASFTAHRAGVDEMVPLRPRSIKSSNFDDASAPSIGTIEISGPHAAKAPEETPSRRQILVCRPTSVQDEEPCARRILATLARRAYRRPTTETDVKELMRLYTAGRQDGSFDAGIGRAVEGLLSMPAFLFRLEQDPASAAPGQSYKISGLELASRLSYFLWKSMPDDELIDLGARGRLLEPAVLTQQVKRMLADAKATRFMNDFVNQWLTIRNLQAMEPDPNIFPDFDDNLRQAMLKETELFFESQVRDNMGALDLLTAKYTFMNQQLARHYGVSNVYGSHFRRVPVSNDVRSGLLGHASVLAVSSYAHRTSVVIRGKWILENLLGTPPPAPPPNVPPLKENDGKTPPKALRDRMEQHRANPVCASCHARMDPLGFAFENFDAIGKWRDKEDGVPIDATSTLVDGTAVAGPAGFRQLLLDRKGQYIGTLVEKLLSYAMARQVEYYDQPTVRQLVRDAAKTGYRWQPLILAIVNSQPFQMRRVQDERPSSAAAQ
ncbi:MAG: DUF1592 domain-containing protein [Acidimicrobiia bacterium]|nr:DUF1592 domain-containing protein [Acidimicrobiia bacterium]